MTEAMFVLFDFEGHVQGLPTGGKVQKTSGRSEWEIGMCEEMPIRSNCPANHTYRRTAIYEHEMRKMNRRVIQRQAGFQISGSSARICSGVLANGRRRKTSHK